MPPQSHPEQKLNARHRLIPGTDARPALDQMVLKPLHIVWLCNLWRSPQPSRKTLAGAQVTGLGCRAEIARCHIGNHAGAKGCCGPRCLDVHGKTLCQSRQNHLDQQHTPDTKARATNPYSAQRKPHSAIIAKRFSASALLRHWFTRPVRPAGHAGGRIVDIRRRRSMVCRFCGKRTLRYSGCWRLGADHSNSHESYSEIAAKTGTIRNLRT